MEKRPKRKSKMFQRGRAKNKKDDDGTHGDEEDDSVSEENIARYSGWISLQWAEEEEEGDGNVVENNRRLGGGGGRSDEDAGPWTGECCCSCSCAALFSLHRGLFMYVCAYSFCSHYFF